MGERTYTAIDLKSFYASVECVARGLDPLTTHLVVADESRTEKTICLAVSPSLKAYGISGRPRLFEVIQRVQEINALRCSQARGHSLSGESYDAPTLARNPTLALSCIVAPPRMSYYLECSARIYQIYLKYIAPEDIHVYSVDEVFMDVTKYLSVHHMTARELTMTMIREVLDVTGITATAGIGSNLYLCKVAMDIVAKKMPPDERGVRIAELDEPSYRQQLWDHRPLTDFWRVGRGYARRLESVGIFTMGDICRCSVGGPNDYYNEALLYKLFGIHAELLIDHAWGWEPCTMEAIKAYRPQSNCLSSGQVLPEAYSIPKARLIVQEMTDLLVLDLVRKGLLTDQLCLYLGYDSGSLRADSFYTGPLCPDHYGRLTPKHSGSCTGFDRPTNSGRVITDAMLSLFDRIADPRLQVRRVNITANHLIRETDLPPEAPVQLNLFDALPPSRDEARERRKQETILDLQRRFGKNAVLKGMNFREGATTINRNSQIGGHKA